MNYWLQSFKFSKSVVRDLEKMFSNFIWKGDLHAWSQDQLCRPKKERGMRLRRITHMSNAVGIDCFGGFALQTFCGLIG